MDKKTVGPKNISDQIMFLGYTGEEKRRLAKEIDRDGLPDILYVTELESEKTDDEITLIEETVRSIAICRKILGLECGPPMNLSQFHVLEPAVWDNHDTLKTMNGRSILGHCYLKRSERWEFAFGLTHEACHAGGFFRFEIRNQPTIHQITCRGMGLGRRYSDSQPFEYMGLLEAPPKRQPKTSGSSCQR